MTPLRTVTSAVCRGGFLAAVALLMTRPAWAVQGNWVTSFLRSENASSEDTWRSNLDLRGVSDFPGGAVVTLRGSFTYYNRNTRYGLEATDGDLLRHRWYADVQKSSVRVRTQFVPWQSVDVGGSGARERVAQVDLNASPSGAPSLSAHYHRLDRRAPTWTAGGVRNERSWSDDWRAQLSYARGGLGSTLAYRRLQSAPSNSSLGARSNTDDWRAALESSKTWRTVSVQGSYDASYSTFSTRDRDRKQYSQRAGASSFWNPTRRLTLGGSGAVQWGRAEDNAIPGSRPRSERFLSGSADYRPIDGLGLRLLRDYRRQSQAGGEIVSDYVQGQATFARDLIRGLAFQTGAQRAVDLASRNGSIPLNSVYGLLDGRLRPGIAARAELRASRAVIGASQTGTQWGRSFQLRTAPARNASCEVTWRRDTLPRFDGQAQTDQEWQYTVGYQPVPQGNLIASYRRLNGTGRLVRKERFGTVSAGIRLLDEASFSVDLSRRESLVLGSRTGEIIAGVDFGFWLPSEVRAKVQWRRVTRRLLQDPARYGSGADSYGLTLDKSF